MRIIAGSLRGQRLTAPEGLTTRPTADRARESLFNSLTSYLMKQGESWSDVTFADVFAGTGAIGLEAASRGAKEVWCIENHPAALACLKQNSQRIRSVHILRDNALMPPPHEPVSFLFMDAPYGQRLWQKALPAFAQSGWIDGRTLIIIETDKKLNESLPAGFDTVREIRAGRNVFLFAKQQEES